MVSLPLIPKVSLVYVGPLLDDIRVDAPVQHPNRVLVVKCPVIHRRDIIREGPLLGEIVQSAVVI